MAAANPNIKIKVASFMYGRVEKQPISPQNVIMKEKKQVRKMDIKTSQIEMVSVEDLISKKHPYRKLKSGFNFNQLYKSVEINESNLGATGFTTERLITCLILQFMENLSDRQFERFISENNAGKWFCGFGIIEKTPDYSTICKFRNKLGIKEIEKLFNAARDQLSQKGYMSETFTFIDATALVSQIQMWEEKDKAISDGYEKFNNEVIGKYAKDKEVRIGAKGKNKFWYGFKKFVTVDMQSGMINKVKVTKANVADCDEEAVKEVLPSQGAVTGDKGFVGSIDIIISKGCHPMVILKNNMSDKDRDKDRFISKLRAPFESVFSKQQKRVRYKGVDKNQAAEFLYAIAFNFRRLLVIEENGATI
jgi:IS5 family transposase